MGRNCLIAATVGTGIWIAVVLARILDGHPVAGLLPHLSAMALVGTWVAGVVTWHLDRQLEKYTRTFYLAALGGEGEAGGGRPVSKLRP